VNKSKIEHSEYPLIDGNVSTRLHENLRRNKAENNGCRLFSFAWSESENQLGEACPTFGRETQEDTI
jgi:hypothetical protein